MNRISPAASTRGTSVPDRDAIIAGEARYCIACGYRLVTTSERRCSECGRAFDPSDPSTYAIRVIGDRPWTFVWRAVISGIVSTVVMILLVYTAPWGLPWWMLVALVPGAMFAMVVVVPLARRADATPREQLIVLGLVASGCPAALFVVEQSSTFWLGSLVGGCLVAAAASWFLNHAARIGIIWLTIVVATLMGAMVDLADAVGWSDNWGIAIVLLFLVGWQPAIAFCLSVGRRSVTAADDPALRLVRADEVSRRDADRAES